MARNHSARFKPLTILEFQKHFATEDDCARFLFEKRWPDGWVCPRCGEKKAYPISKRRLYECSACGHQASVTAGTVLHKTRTPLRFWFIAMFLLVTDKRGISSVTLSKHLGITQKKAWYMLQKLRRAMTKREERYKLKGLVELDESFFGAPKEGGNRGRDTSKIKVLVGLSLDDAGRPIYLRMRALPKLDRAHLEPAIQTMVASGATIRTDGLRGYLSLPARGYSHERVIMKESSVNDNLKWLQVAVSNAKALIGGTYHGLGAKHFQAYLDEYDYRFNRRLRLDLIFDRIATAVATCEIWTYADITGNPAADEPVSKAS